MEESIFGQLCQKQFINISERSLKEVNIFGHKYISNPRSMFILVLILYYKIIYYRSRVCETFGKCQSLGPKSIVNGRRTIHQYVRLKPISLVMNIQIKSKRIARNRNTGWVAGISANRFTVRLVWLAIKAMFSGMQSTASLVWLPFGKTRVTLSPA